jgi:hypothetical protein
LLSCLLFMPQSLLTPFCRILRRRGYAHAN